ncbi:MAG: IS5 family transposase [Halioglobus sp.]|nr:IS5 family transposase [Halioglobus sp.]
MRGEINPQASMFSYVDLESRIPKEHPIRKIRDIVDTALQEIEPWFDDMYAVAGRPSIPPEMLLRATLLQILFTVRSERQLCERIDYDLMFRWFVGLGMDDRVWDHSTFSKNRDRLMASEVDVLLFEAIRKQAYAKQLLSRDHFTVDGTLLEASASLKSFRPKGETKDEPPTGGGRDVDFHGQKRSNETHESTTDPDSRLFRKGPGKEAKMTYMGHILTENRNGFIVETELTSSGTKQEWDAGISMLAGQSTRPGQTIGADKGYDTGDFIIGCRTLGVTPHVAAKTLRSAIDGRTTGTVGYRVSQRKRKQVEECFGWMKTFGLMQKLRHRGAPNASWMFRLSATAYNITRLKAFA